MLKFLLIIFIGLYSSTAIAGQNVANNYTLIPSSEEHAGYFEHLPDAYQNNRESSYPLILFLHGLGERDFGQKNDLENLLRWGPPRIVAKNGSEYSAIHPYRFIILAPQIKSPKSSWKPKDVDDFINFALKNYRINPNRIYLTGISMGGNGVWEYAYSEFNNPNKMAAIVPIAAWGNPNEACKIIRRNIPVWAFHGLKDTVIPLAKGQQMFNALYNCGENLDNTRYRFSPVNAEHTAWPAIYSSVSDSLSIYDWFMEFTLNQIDTINPGSQKPTPDWTPPAQVKVELTQTGVLPGSLTESSGIIRDATGRMWSHNDSGDDPTLYQIDSMGQVIREVSISYARNMDWEDLAKDKKGNLYIADIGNNLNARKKLFIYKVKESDLSKDRALSETISFTYEDQDEFPPSSASMHYDAESLIHYNDALYIFTKNRTDPFTGYTHIYRVPDQPGDYTAKLVDSLKLGEGIMTNYWLTAADINANEDQIALLSHDKLWILSCFEGEKFSNGVLTELILNSYTQKEAVTYLDQNTLILTDERLRGILGGNIYLLNLPDTAIKACE